jgi:uncharacterized protein (TIGR01319 family)
VSLAVCADVGSTFTKVAVVDLADGTLVATADHRTTVDSDVLHGLDAAVAATGVRDAAHTYVCSSAGGGLRLAVVGYERLVTAEAGHRVGLSAGARVVHVAAGVLDASGVRQLRAARPDLVLLVGGTDGGDAEVLLHNADRLARARLRVPVVAAGNAQARTSVVDVLAAAGVAVIATDNVLPHIGELHPQPARAAIRELFLRHVIGGKRLSRGPRFASLVRGATPDLVLTAVELLAEHAGGDLLAVDVGGATTDVYSVLSPDDQPAAEVAGMLWHARTVEGDLGVRWSAGGVVDAARAERLLPAGEEEALAAGARVRAADPAFLPQTGEERAVERRLATLAATVALRRHARGERVGADGPRRGGRDLRHVGLVVGSGGVLRHAPGEVAARLLTQALDDRGGGWSVPRRARVVVDRSYVLAPAGLLAAEHPAAALGLLRGHLLQGAGYPASR